MLIFLLIYARFDVVRVAPPAVQWWLFALLALELTVEFLTVVMFDRRHLQ